VDKPGIAHGTGQAGAAETDTAGGPDADAVVTVYENGPLIVRGRFAITSQDGQPIPAGRRTIALCRCGQSGLKPFCDGSHARTGFRAPGHAEGTRADPELADGGGGAGQPLTRIADATAPAVPQREPAAH
jgi:CDGSH-type Zn-finger protein